MRAFAIECSKTHAGHFQDTLTRISLPSVLVSVRCGELISSVQGCSYLAGCITPISCMQSSTSAEEWPWMHGEKKPSCHDVAILLQLLYGYINDHQSWTQHAVMILSFLRDRRAKSLL